MGEQVELEKRLEELKAQIAKLQANIDSKAENVEKFNLVSDVMTRRVLEAFSTFTFKEGPDKVSLNPQVLALIPDQNKRAYFQNSMYRLVLNTESHLQEAVQGAPEMSFFSHLTVEEKQRTARDVLCFMYCVNPAHVLAHLPNARKELDNWMASIG